MEVTKLVTALLVAVCFLTSATGKLLLSTGCVEASQLVICFECVYYYLGLTKQCSVEKKALIVIENLVSKTLYSLRILIFYALFIVVIQYHDRKHVFHIVPDSTDVG